MVSSNAKTTLRLTEKYQRQPSIFSSIKNGIPMIFFCDVLAYTTYNHAYFLQRKKAIRRKDVPMKHQKKLGQTEMENLIRLPAPETR